MSLPKHDAPPRRPSVVVRLVVVVVLLLAGVHMFATFARVAPPNPISTAFREPTSHHIHPLFNQSWSIFAPNPQLVDLRIWVRASYLDDTGQQAATEWFDISSTFYAQVTNRVVPPRHWRMVAPLYRYQFRARDALTESQQLLLASDYVGDSGRGQLRADLIAADNRPSTVDHYLRSEAMVVEFATNVVYAVHPDIEPQAIQVRTSSQGVVPWSRRDDPDATRPDEHFRELGWRQPIVASDASREAFASVFRRYLDD